MSGSFEYDDTKVLKEQDIDKANYKSMLGLKYY